MTTQARLPLPPYPDRNGGWGGARTQRPRESEPEGFAQLKMELTFTVEVRQYVDLIGYFLMMGEEQQTQYAKFTDEAGWPDWHRPVSFLWTYADPEPGFLPCINPEVVSFGAADVDEYEERVRHRSGSTKTIYSRGETEFTEDDFKALRGYVPWLDALHRQWENRDEDEPPVFIPGPYDIPLEGL